MRTRADASLTGLGRRSPLAALALVWLAAFNLRSVILAVPPVLPEIRTDLHLSFSQAGGLTSIPPLCLGIASIPGALLVNVFGARRMAGLALLGLGLGALARLAPAGLAALFAGTALMSLSVAAAQPALVVLLRGWFPSRTQSASAVLSNGLSVGALVAGSLTPLLVGWAGWRGTFALWAAPVLLVVLIWFVASPRQDADPQPQAGAFRLAMRDPNAWRAAGLFGCQSLIFFTAVAWLPFLLRSSGHGYVALVLFIFLGLGLPATAVLIFLRWPWATSRSFYVLAGLLASAACLGWATGPAVLAWLWAVMAGIALAMVFSGAFALPPLLAPSGPAVAAYSSLMLTLGYALSTLGPAVGGVLVDRTGRLGAPFLPLVAAGLLVVLLGATLTPVRSERSLLPKLA